ncbi:MAG TPA: hypothetical protein VFB96_06180 [Pirellulaceae bacterium]|nr:hypothetical protein [Pirellulaceae bacterium]
MIRAISLVALLLAAFGGRFCQAQSDETPSPWVVAPRREGPLTAKDRRARDAFLKLIDKSQDEKYRKEFEVVVSDKPTGLGEEYDVLLYGRFLDWDGARIEVAVRGDKATAEMVTMEGIFRGALPAEPIDAFVRQLIYAYHARELSRDDPSRSVDRWVYATHTAAEGFVIVSRTKILPLHLRTEPENLIAIDINASTGGIRRFAETRLARVLHATAREKLVAIDRGQQDSEVVARLAKIDPSPIKAKYGDEMLALDDSSRDDLASVEAMLYSQLAVELCLKEALPELRRLKLAEPLAMLTIATADDPTSLLKEAITDEEGRLSGWALDFAVKPPKPAHIQMLVEVLPQLTSPFRVEQVLGRFRELELTPQQQETIARLFSDRKDLISRVVIADYLLDKYGDDRYYDFLHKLAAESRPQEKYELGDPVSYALRSVLWYSAETGKRRSDSAALARAWLAQIPMMWRADGPPLRTLVACLGRLGSRDDLPLLEKFCDHADSSLVVDAVEAVARIDIDAGLRHARRRIDRFVADKDGSASFRWDVWPYFGLIFSRRDVAATEPLEKALAKLAAGKVARARPITSSEELNWGMYQGAPPGSDWIGETRLLLEYLNADGIEKRVAAALAYAKDRKVEPQVLRDVAKQLVADGADPETCRPLTDQAEKAAEQEGR